MTVGATLRLLAVMVLWATCFPLITIGLDLAPHLAFAALRAALAGVCLIALGVFCRRPTPVGVRSWFLIVVVGLGATSMGFLGMFHAAEFVSVGLAGIALVAWPGIAGDNGRGYSQGIAYVLLAATGVSIGNVAIKRLTGQADPIMAMGFQLLIGAAPLALLSILTEDVSLLTWSPKFLLVLLALAVFGSALAFWLWFESLERVTLSWANAFTFLVPIFGLVVGAAFFGERFEAIQATGILLVLTGIFLVQRGATSS